jgi:hypothetical protein
MITLSISKQYDETKIYINGLFESVTRNGHITFWNVYSKSFEVKPIRDKNSKKHIIKRSLFCYVTEIKIHKGLKK